MKRRFILLLLISLFLLVIGIQRVDASVYNGKLYEVWHPDSGFTVFAAESNGYMDYNSWMIKSTTDDKIYYCIDPATPLEGSSSDSHNLYTDKDEIIRKTALTEAKYKKVQLLAYYGYGYKDDRIDHTNKKWYGITQVMIWRVMRPDLTWTFKANRNANPNASLFSNEVAEMNKLISDYSKVPSFANKTININTGEELVIEDTNKVFHNYTIQSNSNYLTQIQDNDKLKVYAEFSSAYTLEFKIVPKTNDKFGALVSSDFQDIIRMGAPEDQSFKFVLNVSGGFLNIQKHDKESLKNIPQGNATLEGAIYEIYDDSNKVVARIKTDQNGLAKTGIDYGSYTIKEVIAPEGYKLNEKVYNCDITTRNKNVTIDVEDEIIKGKIKLLKTKGGAGEKFSAEANAIFEVVDSKGTFIEHLITNEKGMAITILPYGTYKLHQISGADNYIFSDDIELVIKEDKIYEMDVKNLKKSSLEFTKTDYSTSKAIPNTLIEIYKDDDTLLYSGKTDKNGTIIFPNLEIGKYYILEKEAPQYYRLNTEKMYFEVKKNGELIKANMNNYRKEGSLKIIKKDSCNDKLLRGAKIDIYFVENNKKIYSAVTDENGEINIKGLIAGKYYIKEIKAPKGYDLFSDKTYFEIKNEKQEIEIILKNNKKIIVPDTSSYDILSILSVLIILSGIGLLIYEKKY